MSNLGGGEIFVVLLLALLVLGPERLPKAARQIGNFVRQVRQMSSGFQDEIRNVINIDDQPFTPEEAHIRPVPAIEDRSTAIETGQSSDPHDDPELEADIRAQPETSEPAPPAADRHEPGPSHDDAGVPGTDVLPDERAAG